MLLQINTGLKEETKPEDNVAIGIDLGTTNCVVTYFSNNKLQIIPIDTANNTTSNLLPSVVKYLQSGQVLVGNNAIQNNGAGVVISSVKRFMGANTSQAVAQQSNMPIVENTQNQHNAVHFNVGKTNVSAVEVSAEILKFIKKQAEDFIKLPVSKAVITVPAYFNENQRNATKIAANSAGLQVLRLVNEPTAAALAYGLDENITGTYLIYDLGGGTFDVSVLKLQKGIFKVLATGGDTFLGGDDVDTAIVKDIVSVNNLSNLSKDNLQYLQNIAKTCKHNVTNGNYSTTFNINNNSYNYTLTKQHFTQLVRPIINKTINILQNVLADANITDYNQIKGVVLVGGSTRMLGLQSALQNIFTNTPVFCSLNPDEVVAVGAGHLAAVLSGVKQDSVLLDITPLSLGIEINDGLFEKIIHRNSLIPVEKWQEFTTSKDNQTAISINVLQGERELVEDVQSLGKFTLRGIPALQAGMAKVRVTFKLDMDGLLTVQAQEMLSGIKQTIEVKPHVDLSTAQMRSIIEESLEKGQEDIKKRLLKESIANANALVVSLQDAIKVDANLLIDNELQTIQNLFVLINKAVALNNREEIEEHCRKLIGVSKEFTERRINQNFKKSFAGVNLKDIKQ